VTKRSGRNLTDAERAKNGWGRITLRLPAETITLIGILADENNMTRAEYVHELVERADREHAEGALRSAARASGKSPTER